jgi:hypothetical protein
MISKECKMEENIGTTLLISSLRTCTTMTRRRKGCEEGGREEGRKEGRSLTRMSKEKNKTLRHDWQLEPAK